MSDNKFIKHLRGEDTAKSVLEIKNQRTTTSFANMPDGDTSNANDMHSDHRGNATGVLKGTENWKLDGQNLVETTTVYGDGRDLTNSFGVFGNSLWIDATCTFAKARRFSPNTKFVLKLCGHDLETVVGNTIDFTLIVKFGTSNLISKTFSVTEQAFNFCKEFVIDFAESNSETIKLDAGSTMQVQLLCADPAAQAVIYNGMTVFTALQRRVDGETVASDKKTFDEVVQDIDDINDEIDQIHEDVETIQDDIVEIQGDIEDINNKIIIRSATMPTPSADLVGKAYQYSGTTNAQYTHNYIYECQTVENNTLAFTPDTVSCSWNNLSAFLSQQTPDYNSVVKGTLTYVAAADLWQLVARDADDNTVLSYQQYTSDWEAVGFTFTGTYEDGDVVSFERNTTTTYAWVRVNVQPDYTTEIQELETDVDNIQAVIPEQATPTNQLVTQNTTTQMQQQINHLQTIGRFLSFWDATTGLAQTNPQTSPYIYQTGDYFRIGVVASGGGTNYKPSGSSYTIGVASTVVETEPLTEGQVYYYDGANWALAAGGNVAIDGTTIVFNSNNELQAVATVNQNPATGATNPVYDWVGTLAEYQAQNIETLHPDWVCYITDDTSSGGLFYNIGDTFMTKRTDTNLAGAVECDGATYNTTDFTGDDSIGELLEAGKLDYVSLSAYSTAISTKGWCDKIGWDGTGNTQFRVPTLNAHIVQTNNIPVVGNGMSIGLTNGTNNGGLNQQLAGNWGLYTATGAYGKDVNTVHSDGTNLTGIIGITTDGTKSGMIADTTDTAQLRVMIQIANGATDQALETCTGVLADVAGLKDMSNITATGKTNMLQYILGGLQTTDSSKVGYLQYYFEANNAVNAPAGGKWLVLDCLKVNTSNGVVYVFSADFTSPVGSIVAGGTQIAAARSGYTTRALLLKVE